MSTPTIIATGIGSLPFADADRALDLIFLSCPEAPYWPQLPPRSFLENMYVQSLYGLPGLVVDEQNETLYIDTRETGGVERFYEDASVGNVQAFSLPEQVAPGFYRFLERFGEVARSARVVKGQLTGPFTCGLGVKDENGKAIIYDPAYFDMVKRMLQQRGRWMAQELAARCPDCEVLLFFDEPFMVSFGSAYVSVSKEEVVAYIDDVLQGVGATTGIHCCGNTDWSVLMATAVNIINYDAFNFLETVFYYKEEVRAFLGRGGSVSPGIVPSTEAVRGATHADMTALWSAFLALLKDVLPAGEVARMYITPACGLGSVKPDEAVRAFDLLRELASAIRYAKP